MVVTVDPAGAGYLGFRLGSDYFASFDYENHTGSLSADQPHPNADGTITYVIWLDPVGHPQGLMFVRWQGTSAPITVARVVQIVPMSALSSALPEGTEFISTATRAQQIAERKSQVALRR